MTVIIYQQLLKVGKVCSFGTLSDVCARKISECIEKLVSDCTAFGTKYKTVVIVYVMVKIFVVNE